MKTNRAVRILYTNWKGETAWRRILPDVFYFSSTEHHPIPQWLLKALDYDKDDVRTFAFKDILKWEPLE